MRSLGERVLWVSAPLMRPLKKRSPESTRTGLNPAHRKCGQMRARPRAGKSAPTEQGGVASEERGFDATVEGAIAWLNICHQVNRSVSNHNRRMRIFLTILSNTA